VLVSRTLPRLKPFQRKRSNVNDDTPLIIEAPETATASVIWLHGLGADGHDFEPIVAELGDAVTRHVRYVFPHAPRIPVSINGGMVMRAWYDIADTDLANRADEAGVRASAGIVEKLIEEELAKGIASTRILLAGFSQGGAIALHTGLRYAKPLAGILALSTYLPLQDTLGDERHDANRNIPVFLAHGSQDPVIPLALSESSRQLLVSLGYSVQCHTIPTPCPIRYARRRSATWPSGWNRSSANNSFGFFPLSPFGGEGEGGVSRYRQRECARRGAPRDRPRPEPCGGPLWRRSRRAGGLGFTSKPSVMGAVGILLPMKASMSINEYT